MTGLAPIRWAADRLFRGYARRRVRAVDRQSLAAVQSATLFTLLRRAANTRFGREHGFDSIRTVRDYQRRVPLRDYEAFWRHYWQPAFPVLQDVTLPGVIPYFALSSGTTTGTTKYIPVSDAMLASNRRAALTGLSWLHATRPDAALFRGRMLFLGGSTDLRPLAVERGRTIRAGDLSGIATREVPAALRPFTYPPLDLALETDWDRKLDRLAKQGAAQPVTLVSGVPSWLLVFFERLLRVTGRRAVADVWPTLRVVVHGGTRFDPYRGLFRRVIGSNAVATAETYPASEGFVAAEDPRLGLLRLIPDHGVYFEFVPADELGSPRPTRHTAAEVEPGVRYAVILTTCAGLWSYVLGDTVRFERTDPPGLHFAGRVRDSLSAFGEHLIGEEVERAMAHAAAQVGTAVTDFHVGPVFPGSAAEPGRHRYLVEFAQPPGDVGAFARSLDAELGRINEDYQAHRAGDLTMLAPEVWPVRRGGFADWLRSRGQLGGQHKVPRMDATGRLTAELAAWLTDRRSTDRPGAPGQSERTVAERGAP
jgi:hypothetical protein